MDGQMFFKTLLQKKNAQIQFSGQDETISFPVKDPDVTIIGSSGDHQLGSSKLHMKNIVNYAWEHKYYPGQVVCHHMGGEYIAYSIITAGKNMGSVRVVNRRTSERILIKGMQGAVVDVSFAHIQEDVVIGCVDELGNLFVYRVTENSSGLHQERMLEVLRDKNEKEEHRLIWCPYLNTVEEGEEEDTSCAYLLLLTHGNILEIWDLNTVQEEHGTGPFRPEDVTDGLLKLSDEGTITDAAFSPDGTALVTTSSQGQVKFYQVYMKGDETPRCLRQWAPHQGKPVSSLIFLDDYSQYNANASIWRYAVTGCKYNTELKIWSCKSWTCLQTIKFQPREGEDSSRNHRLKITSDSSSKYLVLSDIDRQLVYVLTLRIDGEEGDQEDTETASVVSITEFQTPSPFLSMSCMSAGLRQVSINEDGMTVEDDIGSNSGGANSPSPHHQHHNTNNSTTDSKEKTVIKLCIVQPKSLQECSLIFDDAAEAVLPQTTPVGGGGVTLPPQGSIYPPLPALLPPPPPASSTVGAAAASNGLSEITANIDTTGIIISSSPKLGHNSSTDDLAEAASKITLLSPAKLKALVPSHPSSSQDIVDQDDIELEEISETEVEVPDDDADDEEGEGGESDDSEVPKLELVSGGCIGGVTGGGSDGSSGGASTTKDLSGNSSPSREVATILSSDERNNKYEDSPLDDSGTLRDTQSPISAAPPSAAYKNLEAQILNTSGASVVSGTKFPTPPAVIPASLNTSLGGASSSGSASAVGGGARTSVPLEYSDLSTTLTAQNAAVSGAGQASLINMIYDLQKEVAALRKDLYTQQKLTSSSLQENIEATVNNAMADTINSMEQKLLIQEELLMKKMSTSMSAKCDQVITMELKRSVVDIVNKALDPLKNRIDSQISNKLNNSEQVIRDSVYKVVNSQGFQDSLSRSVSQTLQPIITESYRSILQASLPGIEKSLQHTLANVNHAFVSGTKEYEAALRGRLEASEKAQRDELAPVLKDLKKSLGVLTANQNKLMSQMGEVNDRLDNKLANGLTDIVRREVRSALQTSPHLAAAAVTSPGINHSDVRETIQRLLLIGNFDEAFQTALSANDLSVVVSTCEKVDLAALFNDSPCPLSQSVLLSLIQQLSQNLMDRTDLKCEYIEEGLQRLDIKFPVTRMHMGRVTKEVQKSVQNFIQNNPNSKFSRRLRTLLMAINGVLAQANTIEAHQ